MTLLNGITSVLQYINDNPALAALIGSEALALSPLKANSILQLVSNIVANIAKSPKPDAKI
jgi:hypothetical protein